MMLQKKPANFSLQFFNNEKSLLVAASIATVNKTHSEFIPNQ